MTRRRNLQKGVTLIEMMIALVIGMVLSVAVMMVLSTFEGRRRTLGSTSDLDQTGALAMFQLDRWIRSAGSGLAQGGGFSYGCRIFASSGGSQILPLASSATLPAPFASVSPATSGEFRLAPVMILPGQTTPAISGSASDVLVVMSAGNDASQVPTPSTAPPTASKLSVNNVTEFASLDLLLVADQQVASGGGPADCMITQASNSVPSGVSTSLNLGGTGTTYYASTIGTLSLTNFTDASVAFDLGSATANGTNQPPSFQVIGVGDNNTLYSYDLLKIGGTSTAQPQADGVFEMHAVYGIDSDGDNKIDNWVDAGSTSAYSVSALSGGSAGSMALLKNIRAVRVALIMRTSLPEKDAVTASTTLSMFSDLSTYGVNLTRTLSADEQHYRYRVVESTIPVRNNNF